ncbi:hypothetical protein [Rickettsia endosymbiont of Lasioglossum villosulum]|uniref:tetratricopeptide repeat protein n=1 Tax=Rickettsia endosymbiont of Lasioglossum villosulum TaxID=3066269 RepID=UPI003132DCCD
MEGKINSFRLIQEKDFLCLPNQDNKAQIFKSNLQNKFIELYKCMLKEIDFKDYLRIIQNLNAPELALEFANLAITRIANKKNNLLKCLLENYPYEKLKNHKLFIDYEISEDGSYLEHKFSKSVIFFEYKSFSNSSCLQDKIFNNFLAKKSSFYLAAIEQNIQLMEAVSVDIFKTGHIVLNLLNTIDQEKYKTAFHFIIEIVHFIKPEFQFDIIKQLADTIAEDFNVLATLTNVLLEFEKDEEIITLLEPKLLTIKNNVIPEEEGIIFCRFNLSLAYFNVGNLSLAEKQLLHFLKTEPDDKDALYNLFNIYLTQQKLDKAKDLTKNSPKDLKILMEMSLDLAEISAIKLNSINQDELPATSKSQFRCFEYIAKFNSYNDSERDSNYENLKEELIEIDKVIDYAVLSFTTAIYTKQYELAAQFAKKIPKNIITPYIEKTRFLLTPVEYISEVHIEELRSKFDLSQEDAIDLVIQVSSCLVADEQYKLALEKIEEILLLEPQNYSAIEIGLSAAELINNQEKIQEYSVLLHEKYEKDFINDIQNTHKYYRSIKELNLRHAINNTNSNVSNWLIKEGEINKNDAISLGKYKGLDCYGRISTDIKCDSTQYNEFINALEKGIIYKQQGNNGVKFLKENAVEIKINGGNRLYTNILNTNPQGELLINFDHFGNHKDVIKFVGEHNLEFHEAFELTQKVALG